jgi:RNA polymerase sigma-54 factor
MIAEIKALNPKPATAFDITTAQPVTPDVLMRARPGGGWIIELNPDTMPRVLVNHRYYAVISQQARSQSEKEYIIDRFNSASWLVKSLHQRAQTILKVATEIVEQQDLFFTAGVEHLKPLTLRDVANVVAVHESTVSRVTNNKFIATPRGVYELKYFFNSGVSRSEQGSQHSAEAIRFRIRSLIDGETVENVLSDDQIVDILRGGGVDIARRTVAKYREAMRIPSSVQRRREKALHL